MRAQTTTVRTGREKRLLMTITAALLLLAAAALVWRVAFYQAPFVPPAFDQAAQSGVPSPDQNMGYGKVSAENGFSFFVVGTMYQQQDGSMLVYLTNPEDSGCNLQCEVANADGEILYRSGAIAPGTYVERLAPLMDFPNETMKIEMNVYAFEPDTWYSKGTISLANTLHPW